MIKRIYILLAIIAPILILVAAAGAQTNQPSQAVEQVTEKGFRGRVFEVKHRDPNSLARVLRTLGSGARGFEVNSNSEFNTISVRDFPENITVMEEALKRLDTPAAPRANIELHMHVLLASKTGETGSTQVPAEIKDVIAQLRETFSYRGFEVATTVTQRLTETERGLGNNGTMQVTHNKGGGGVVNLDYSYLVNQVSLSSTGGVQVIQINEFAFSTKWGPTGPNAKLQTALNLKDGEKVVVGTAAFEDRALIVVLTAKLIK